MATSTVIPENGTPTATSRSMMRRRKSPFGTGRVMSQMRIQAVDLFLAHASTDQGGASSAAVAAVAATAAVEAAVSAAATSSAAVEAVASAAAVEAGRPGPPGLFSAASIKAPWSAGTADGALQIRVTSTEFGRSTRRPSRP